jgi:hypothetical protein
MHLKKLFEIKHFRIYARPPPPVYRRKSFLKRSLDTEPFFAVSRSFSRKLTILDCIPVLVPISTHPNTQCIKYCVVQYLKNFVCFYCYRWTDKNFLHYQRSHFEFSNSNPATVSYTVGWLIR